MSAAPQRAKLKTPIFRASFPHLFEAKAMEEGQEAKYSIAMIFPKKDESQLKELRAACIKVAKEKFGSDYDRLVKTGKLKMPFRDGAEKEHLEGYGEGTIFASATSKRRPGIVDHALERIHEADAVYAGCFCRASVTPFAFDVKGNKGVALGLNNVQKLKDGDRLDGGTPPENDFDAVEQEPADGDGLD